MQLLLFALSPAFLLLNNCNNPAINTAEVRHDTLRKDTLIVPPIVNIPFDSLRKEYKTLIPLFDGLFITYAKIDSAHYKQVWINDSLARFFSGGAITKDAQKWGVIDSTGKVIVPFICDGIKAVAKGKGIASVYEGSRSLNTGVPRYKYEGKYFFFTKDGRTAEKEERFAITVVHLADQHDTKFVISQGPAFYLPNAFQDARDYKKAVHGNVERQQL